MAYGVILSFVLLFHFSMAIVPKSSVLQIRLDPAFRLRFEAACVSSGNGVKPAAACRALLEAFVIQAEERARRLAVSTAKRLSRSIPPSVPVAPVKAPVVRPVASGGLSDRLRLEREVKRAKKKKREDRWLQD